ncbi:MAG TPA: hypothetical protein VGS11_09310 [Candidatus Bathyarchaeia archaeon]|nr:hypothetical protein [Candidatus Bathyarchaeia archaeon]
MGSHHAQKRMKSYRIFNNTPVKTLIPIGPSSDRPRRNSGVNLSEDGFRTLNMKMVSPSFESMKLLHPAIGNVINENSRILSWDNPSLFGPSPDTGTTAEKSVLEKE